METTHRFASFVGTFVRIEYFPDMAGPVMREGISGKLYTFVGNLGFVAVISSSNLTKADTKLHLIGVDNIVAVEEDRYMSGCKQASAAYDKHMIRIFRENSVVLLRHLGAIEYQILGLSGDIIAPAEDERAGQVYNEYTGRWVWF